MENILIQNNSFSIFTAQFYLILKYLMIQPSKKTAVIYTIINDSNISIHEKSMFEIKRNKASNFTSKKNEPG